MKVIITLLKTLLLSHYPSGSSISCHEGLLYVIGDDATQLLVLDSNYNTVNTVTLFEHKENRIPKAQKADLETAVVLDVDGQKSLLALGSGATKEREIAVLLGFPATDHTPRYISSAAFMKRLHILPEVNIEGATLVGKRLILANRGNESNPENHLVVTDMDFWTRQEAAPINIVKLVMPATLPGFAGVSELCYNEQEDVMLVILSSEATANAYDDGAIGDSYFAWIRNFSQKLGDKDVMPDGIVNLSDADPAFKGEKMEGICLSVVDGKEWYFHLVADNDKGASRLFYIKVAMGE